MARPLTDLEAAALGWIRANEPATPYAVRVHFEASPVARFSGSANLEQAIDWVIERMKADGLDNVRGEPVMVPRWVRGIESAELMEPRKQNLPMLGLGGSIATPPGGITAEVLVVSSFEIRKPGELEAFSKAFGVDVGKIRATAKADLQRLAKAQKAAKKKPATAKAPRRKKR